MNRPSTIVYWNTGRDYGTEGQIILAQQVGDRIFFRDVTRQIAGSCLSGSDFDLSPPAVARTVMGCYDAGLYADVLMSATPSIDDLNGAALPDKGARHVFSKSVVTL